MDIKQFLLSGPPESPGGCRGVNQTEREVWVECRLGYSGGLPQRIHLEIYSNTGQVLANTSGIHTYIKLKNYLDCSLIGA